MSRWAVALVLACACGRINFDPLTGDELVDASTDGSTMATCVNWGMWSTPSVIPMLESDGFDWAPTISDDDLRMTFSSDRTGDFELYTSSRPTEASEWSAPVVINELRMDGPEEDDATLSSNELEMLYGNTLIFRTTRTTTSSAWNPPNVLIPNDFDFVQGAELTRDDLRLYFSAGSPNEDLFLMERPTPTSAFGSYARIMPDPDPGNDIGYPAISTDELELYVSSDHGENATSSSRDARTARIRSHRSRATISSASREPTIGIPSYRKTARRCTSRRPARDRRASICSSRHERATTSRTRARTASPRPRRAPTSDRSRATSRAR